MAIVNVGEMFMTEKQKENRAITRTSAAVLNIGVDECNCYKIYNFEKDGSYTDPLIIRNFEELPDALVAYYADCRMITNGDDDALFCMIENYIDISAPGVKIQMLLAEMPAALQRAKHVNSQGE